MTTYYVKTSANGGSDANAGTSAGAAWATLQHAADNVSPGDVVKVFPGEYARFDISSGGSSGAVITFEANDLNDRPYVRTAYHGIADSALGSTNRPDAGIYVTADYVTINGFRFSDERAIAIAFQWEGANTYNVTVSNCRFYRCRAVLKITAKLGETMVIGGKTVKIDKKATGPIWISHKGKGYANRNIHFHDLEFIECWARVPVTGGGTEIVTFNGAHDGILVEDCYWKDCYGINLNFLGVDSTNPGGTDVLGQPRNIVARRNTFINAFRTNDGVQASVNSLYFDRGTGPAEIYENLFYNNASRASVKSSFE
ncbi:MAG: hypothetical protein KDE20_27455, partial [Caldilineaceae bacterium]|nr:hypothetical protein [Caldilineaceae bacterium]